MLTMKLTGKQKNEYYGDKNDEDSNDNGDNNESGDKGIFVDSDDKVNDEDKIVDELSSGNDVDNISLSDLAKRTFYYWCRAGGCSSCSIKDNTALLG